MSDKYKKSHRNQEEYVKLSAIESILQNQAFWNSVHGAHDLLKSQSIMNGITSAVADTSSVFMNNTPYYHELLPNIQSVLDSLGSSLAKLYAPLHIENALAGINHAVIDLGVTIAKQIDISENIIASDAFINSINMLTESKFVNTLNAVSSIVENYSFSEDILSEEFPIYEIEEDINYLANTSAAVVENIDPAIATKIKSFFVTCLKSPITSNIIAILTFIFAIIQVFNQPTQVTTNITNNNTTIINIINPPKHEADKEHEEKPDEQSEEEIDGELDKKQETKEE